VLEGSDQVEANGTTDYFEVFARHNAGTTRPLYGDATAIRWNFFSGELINGGGGSSFSPGTWQNLSLTANFTSWGASYTPQYRVDSAGICYLRGLVKNTVQLSVATVIMFTLPAGARPAPVAGQTTANPQFIAHGYNGSYTPFFLQAFETGVVSTLAPVPWAINSYISLDQISFDTGSGSGGGTGSSFLNIEKWNTD